MARVCPDCRGSMSARSIDGVELDICGGCHSIWFDPQELKTLISNSQEAIEHLEAAASPVEHQFMGASALLCPVDGVPLQQYHYLYSSPVLLQGCPTCGGFLMHSDELPKMAEVLADAHTPSPQEAAAMATAMMEVEHQREMVKAQGLRVLGACMTRIVYGGWHGW